MKEKEKEKNKKSTLNNHHRIILDKFKKEKNRLPKYKLDKEKYIKKLEKLEKKNNKKCTEKEIETKFFLKEQIYKLTKQIENIEDKKDKTEYFLVTFDLLNDYFTNQQNCSDCEEDSPEEDPENNLLSFFKKKEDDTQISMSKFINKKNKLKKSDLYEQFLNKIELKYSGKHEFTNNFDLCNQCKVKKMLIQNEGRYVCVGCGKSEYIIIDSEKPSYKEAMSSDCSAYQKYLINYHILLIIICVCAQQ